MGSDFPQSFIVKNSKQRINFNTRCVANVTFWEVASNHGIFKQASENSPNEYRSTSGSKDAAMKIC